MRKGRTSRKAHIGTTPSAIMKQRGPLYTTYIPWQLWTNAGIFHLKWGGTAQTRWHACKSPSKTMTLRDCIYPSDDLDKREGSSFAILAHHPMALEPTAETR